MSGRATFKVAIDCMMTVLLLLLMAYSLIGEALHEWLGVGMFLLLVPHHILNVSWYKNLGKGRYSAYRIFQSVLVVLLLVTMMVTMGSGIVMSRHTLPVFPIRGWRSLARTLHLPCSYWSFVLMSLHLGLHWGMMMGAVRRLTGAGPSRRLTFLLRAAGTAVALYGMAAFIRNDILSYLFLRTHFVFINYERPMALFFVDYLAMMGLFLLIGYYTGKFLQRVRRSEKT